MSLHEKIAARDQRDAFNLYHAVAPPLPLR
jgi:hypothetical protein